MGWSPSFFPPPISWSMKTESPTHISWLEQHVRLLKSFLYQYFASSSVFQQASSVLSIHWENSALLSCLSLILVTCTPRMLNYPEVLSEPSQNVRCLYLDGWRCCMRISVCEIMYSNLVGDRRRSRKASSSLCGWRPLFPLDLGTYMLVNKVLWPSFYLSPLIIQMKHGTRCSKVLIEGRCSWKPNVPLHLPLQTMHTFFETA